MNLSKKQRTIKAFEKIIKNIKNPERKNGPLYEVGYYKDCPLCRIHHNYIGPSILCKGCPLASLFESIGCHKRSSYIKLRKAAIRYVKHNNINRMKEEYLEALPEVEKMLKYIKRLSPKRFTKKGWKYVNWRKIL